MQARRDILKMREPLEGEEDKIVGYSNDELRKLIQAGIDSGPGRYLDIDELMAECHRHLAEEKKNPKKKSDWPKDF